jgi:putative ABC transport system permease protein
MGTANAFELLGVTALRGRTFSADEDKPGAAGVALISYGLWQRRFQASDQAIGQPITLDNKPYTIIGVLPPGFEMMQQQPEIMVPFSPWARTLPDDRSWHPGILPFARLKPGVTLEQARTEMSGIAQRLEQQYPIYNTGTGANVNSMQGQLVENVRPALLMLLGAVGFVLLIACANVANLLLARAVARQKEIAVRQAIGASRWRIARQLLTESIVLSLAGAAVGIALARLAMPPLLRLAATSLPGTDKIAIDAGVLAFTTAVAVIAGIAFGLAPALHTGGADMRAALNETDRSGVAHGAVRLRSVLVVAEVALATLLLMGAGLLLRSFGRLASVSPGFAPDHILIADIPVSPSTHPNPAERMAFFDRVLERASSLPGVKAAGAASFLPVSGAGAIIHFNIQGRPPKTPHEYVPTNYRTISAGYLQALAVPLMSGRFFTDADRDGAPAVVIINQTMAHTYFPNESPLGKHLQLGATPSNEAPWMEVVGVVGDVKMGLAAEAPTEMYVPNRQGNQVLPVFAVSYVLRTASEPLTLANAFRAAVHEIDRNQPVVKMRTMEQNIATSIAQPRFRTLLLAVFAGVALALAGVGIYGVIAYSVTQRRREIGIRMALGSSPQAVFRLVVGDGLRLALIGVAIGVAAAISLARYLATLLFQVRAHDPATLGSVALLLLAIALVACSVPARRATRVNPMVALRTE